MEENANGSENSEEEHTNSASNNSNESMILLYQSSSLILKKKLGMVTMLCHINLNQVTQQIVVSLGNSKQIR